MNSAGHAGRRIDHDCPAHQTSVCPFAQQLPHSKPSTDKDSPDRTGFPTRSVLSSAIIVFGCIVTLFLIIDAATGGKIKATTSNGKVKYGSWAPDALFPLYAVSGIAYGMVELIRRVIPREYVSSAIFFSLSQSRR
jgi:hypothetical protein